MNPARTGVARVLIFGLDAASPDLIDRWRDDLPHLRRLIAAGTWGRLASTLPPFTSPAWECMATGKNPAKVGAFGLRHRRPGSYEFAPASSAQRRAAAVWDRAGEAGRQVLVFNVPGTYPPSPVNGRLVSGRPAPPDAAGPTTYPVDLRAELDRVTGGYPVGPSADFDEGSRADELPTWERVVARQQLALDHLLTTQPWDLCFAVSMAVDGISHHFWKYLDVEHPDYDPAAAAEHGDTIRRVYQLEDERLGRVLNHLGPDDLLLVVSDHGSAPCYRHIAVNRWLIDHGYLVLRAERSADRGERSLFGTASQLAVDLYRRSRLLRRVVRPLRATALRDAVVHTHFARKTGGRVPIDALPIDWPRTTAYYLGDDRLYLNVRGREPSGTVSPGAEYAACRDELRAALRAAVDTHTGRRLCAAVHARDEVYSGPYLAEAPDLILVPGDVHWNLGGAVGDVVVDRPVVGGKHHPEGVYIAWGSGVRPGQEQPASIYDIAPTVLHAMGLPVPADSDGSVQFGWFEPDSPVARREVALHETGDFDGVEHEWAPEEEAQIEARLRDLGYLD